MFWRRSSIGSRPTTRAISSTMRSMAKHAPGRATPRYGPIGALLVATVNVFTLSARIW